MRTILAYQHLRRGRIICLSSEFRPSMLTSLLLALSALSSSSASLYRTLLAAEPIGMDMVRSLPAEQAKRSTFVLGSSDHTKHVDKRTEVQFCWATDQGDINNGYTFSHLFLGHLCSGCDLLMYMSVTPPPNLNPMCSRLASSFDGCLRCPHCLFEDTFQVSKISLTLLLQKCQAQVTARDLSESMQLSAL